MARGWHYYTKVSLISSALLYFFGKCSLCCYCFFLVVFCFLKKNQSTPRPSEHPPVMGEKMLFLLCFLLSRWSFS